LHQHRGWSHLFGAEIELRCTGSYFAGSGQRGPVPEPFSLQASIVAAFAQGLSIALEFICFLLQEIGSLDELLRPVEHIIFLPHGAVPSLRRKP
jgi:hypothetical protein